MRIDCQDRPALSEDHVNEIIREEVIEIVWGQFSKMFGSIKTAMVKYFDKRYAAIAEMVATEATTTVTAAGGVGRVFQ